MERERWELLFALAEDQHGAFTSAQSDELGIDHQMRARAMRDRLIDRIRPRVFVVRPLIDDDTPMAAVQLAFPRAVASHRYAGWKHRYDGVDVIHPDVIVPPNVRLRGSSVHRATDLVVPEIVLIDDLRCTDEIRTLCDLGAVLGDLDLERAVESWRRRPGRSMTDLRERAEALARKGKSGPQALLRVLDRVPSVPTESDLETMYWALLRDEGVELPVRQHAVGSYRLDLAYVPEKVFVELDGYGAHGGFDAFGRDRRRQNDIVLNDWVPLRFTDSDVRRYGRRTARITQALLQRRRALLIAGTGA